MTPDSANKPELFTLGDWEATYLGYRRIGMTWNGFQCPLFPLATVRKIAEMTSAVAEENPAEEVEVITIDEDGVVWIQTMCQGKPVTDAFMESPHHTKYGSLYSIGSFGWTWDLLSPENFEVISEPVAEHPCESCGEPVREDEFLGNDRPDGTSEYLCENCYKPAQQERPKPTDIIADASIRMFLKGDTKDLYCRIALIEDVMLASREFCIEWLATDDRNGIYRDEDLIDEGRDPMTALEARALLIAQLLED